MPRFRLNKFVSNKREGSSSLSSVSEDLDPQAEWEKNMSTTKNEEDLVSRSTIESDAYSHVMSCTSQHENMPPLLPNIREEVTNNSGSFDPPEDRSPRASTPKTGRVSPTPHFAEVQGDSGYADDFSKGQYRQTKTQPQYGNTSVITRVRSNSSRLDNLAHSKARLLVLNENLTLRSLRPDESASELISRDSTSGTPVEELLQNFGRIPMDKIHHFAMVGEYLRTLHVESKMVDALIHVSGQTFAAHRVALACHSKYFADMFIHHDEKTKLPVEITLTGMGPVAFQAFLRFIYTGEMIVSPESIGDVLSVSERLNIPQIRDICCEYIETIPVEQAMVIIASKLTNRKSRIFKHAYNQVVNNFSEVFDVDHFLKLSLDLVCLLLSDDHLYVTSEMDVFWAGLKWVAYHITERHNYVTRIMKCVRFSLLSKRELFQCFEVTDLLRKSPTCRDMVLAANWLITAEEMCRNDPLNMPKPTPRMSVREGYVPTNPEPLKLSAQGVTEDDIGEPEDNSGRLLPVEDSRKQKPVSFQSQKSGRAEMTVGPKPNQPGDILAIGGFHRPEKDKDALLRDVERYSSIDNQWKYYTGLPEPRQQHAVAMLGGKLYLVGGTDPKKSKKHPNATHTSFVFDPAKGAWTKTGALKTARMGHTICPLFGMLYAIGGQDDKNRVLSSVECYNPKGNSWHQVKDLITARCGFGACVCDGRIYVAGGYGPAPDKRSNMPVLNMFECYDPKLNVWTDLCKLNMSRCLCNLVTVENTIYLCGGATRVGIKDDIRSVASIEVYDIGTNNWTYKTELVKPRHSAGATVIGSKIYMIGGICGVDTSETLQSIECFDTRTECWDTSIQDLPYPAKWLGCVALPGK